MSPTVTHVLLEAALRAIVLAMFLWLGMRLLRVSNALVQKAAWTMVLGAAVAMPFAVQWQLRPSWASVSLPGFSWSKWLGHARQLQQISAAAAVQPREARAAADSALKTEEQLPVDVDSYIKDADSGIALPQAEASRSAGHVAGTDSRLGVAAVPGCGRRAAAAAYVRFGLFPAALGACAAH
jgi:hypothetical protein